MRWVESRDVLETAHRLMNYCGNIYRYAVATGRAERDISSDLRGAEHLPERRRMMQAWSDYLDGLEGRPDAGVQEVAYVFQLG
jgi:hypothetical protein